MRERERRERNSLSMKTESIYIIFIIYNFSVVVLLQPTNWKSECKHKISIQIVVLNIGCTVQIQILM